MLPMVALFARTSPCPPRSVLSLFFGISYRLGSKGVKPCVLLPQGHFFFKKAVIVLDSAFCVSVQGLICVRGLTPLTTFLLVSRFFSSVKNFLSGTRWDATKNFSPAKKNNRLRHGFFKKPRHTRATLRNGISNTKLQSRIYFGTARTQARLVAALLAVASSTKVYTCLPWVTQPFQKRNAVPILRIKANYVINRLASLFVNNLPAVSLVMSVNRVILLIINFKL